MKNNFKILTLIVILIIVFISVNTYGLNESGTMKPPEGMLGGIPDKNASSFEEEDFEFPPPPEMDIAPPPEFDESNPPQRCDNPQVAMPATSEPAHTEININTSSKDNLKETPSEVKNKEESTSKNNEQTNNSIGIKWYYLLPLFLIPFLLFFLMSENAVVADAEFLQNVKAESSIFHKFRNIYVTPHIYSEISKFNQKNSSILFIVESSLGFQHTSNINDEK